VVYTGRTSIDVKVDVFGEELNTGEVKKTSTAYVTMVAIDENGKPVEVPPVLAENEEEKSEYQKAERRRSIRKELSK
ncbi:MAG: acyl-CoA thioesterase, partial [candidate division Zixibacteria bacterium]|nr:acyl-CoA thioesterase [candidate division Zixibacteria bacterium]